MNFRSLRPFAKFRSRGEHSCFECQFSKMLNFLTAQTGDIDKGSLPRGAIMHLASSLRDT